LKKNLVLPALVLGVAALAQAQGQVPTKIAVINVQTAILSTKDGQKAAADLQTAFNPRQQDLEKKQADLTALQDQLRKGSATMSEEAKTKLMRDIDATTTRVNRDRQDASSDLDEAQGKIMQELGGKMMAVLEKYAVQNGYAVVLDVSNQQTPVLWAASAVEITNDIVKLYDQAYPGTAAAPAAKPPAAAPAAVKPPAAPAAAPAAVKPPAAPAKK
jgi:outer membrane protein